MQLRHHDDTDAGQPHCQTCNSMVSHRFQLVFGDNQDEVYACPNCANLTAIARGAGAQQDSQEHGAR